MLFYLYCTHFLHVSSSPVPSSTSDYKLPFVLASFHWLCVAHVPREMKISVVDTLFDNCSGYPLFSLSHNIWFVFCTAAHATRPYWHHLDFFFYLVISMKCMHFWKCIASLMSPSSPLFVRHLSEITIYLLLQFILLFSLPSLFFHTNFYQAISCLLFYESSSSEKHISVEHLKTPWNLSQWVSHFCEGAHFQTKQVVTTVQCFSERDQTIQGLIGLHKTNFN